MNKKYHIYAIGNAIVDIVTKVPEAFLTEQEVNKGEMTLVDEAKQKQLMDHIDLTTSDLICGGSASNTTVMAAMLGSKTYYCCKVANDELGLLFLNNLSENGVDSNLIANNLPEGLTGRCLVMTTPDTERTMNTFLGITATFDESLLDEQAIADSDYLYIEGYLITSPNGKQAMIKAKELAQKVGTKVALTFSDPAMANFFKDDLKDVVGDGIDLLFCNEEESQLYTGAQDYESAGEALSKVCPHVVITRGDQGTKVLKDGTWYTIPVHGITPIDSNGAGDGFAGAYLNGITSGISVEKAGELGCRLAAKVVSQFGPRLTLEEAQTLKKEVLS